MASSGAPLDAAMADTLIAVAAVMNQLEEDRARQIAGRGRGRGRAPDNDGWSISTARRATSRFMWSRAAAMSAQRPHDERAHRLACRGTASSRARSTARRSPIELDRLPQGYRLSHAGVLATAIVRTKRATELAARMPEKVPADLSKFLLCPMPGAVVKILVEEGETVQAGQNLAVVEAMKMENVLRAVQEGVVSKICVEVGDNLTVDQVIMEFE